MPWWFGNLAAAPFTTSCNSLSEKGSAANTGFVAMLWYKPMIKTGRAALLLLFIVLTVSPFNSFAERACCSFKTFTVLSLPGVRDKLSICTLST